MHSAIYTGRLRHRRFAPHAHEFAYRLFMMYIDLAELDQVFRHRWLWSVKRPSLAWLRRADYLGDPDISLDQAVRDRVEFATGVRPTGPIRMLTHLRYFGVGFNPVTFYYCFDEAGDRVETIVAEITNTPWKERHAYVLAGDLQSIPSPGRRGGVREGAESHKVRPLSASPPATGGEEKKKATTHLRYRFKKIFHVSPFMAMNFDYDWRFSAPSERLTVHMENLRDGQKAFDATLDLKRREISGYSLAATLLSFPAMTVAVLAGIYWQALRLWIKRVPFHSHPSKDSNHERHSRTSPIG